MQPIFRFPTIAMIASLLLYSSCSPSERPVDSPAPESSAQEASAENHHYVGSDACGSCHADAYEQWLGSHHAQAMQIASKDTVKAPLNNANSAPALVADGHGILFKSDDEPGPLQVAYTFGVEPLQQYLVPTKGGRLQALRWAWDSRSSAAGGQRWFQLYPEETIPPGDVLHWRSMSQNWNSMCADCHSTAVQKKYDPAQDAYQTEYAELTVGCEACHGPGSQHATQPERPLPAAGRLAGAATQPEICAPCHSRRSQLREGFDGRKPLLDYYLPALLNPPLYHADGQILDEVYVYGSFVSSKMHAKGVVCSNCHEPHSAKLRIPGNGTCTQCHSEAGNPDFPTLQTKDYTDADHHLHKNNSPGSYCTDCHMPTRTYMVVDDRHDHSFRVPRPDLSQTFGTPQPCQNCHQEKSHAWASDILRRAFGEPDPGHFSAALVLDTTTAAGETGLSALATDTSQPAIARATAVVRLATGSRNASTRAINQATGDDDALVRFAALTSVGRLHEAVQHAALRRGLTDPVAAVRMEAARQVLSLVQPAQWEAFSPALEAATKGYVASQMLNADRPEAHVNLAALRLQQGNTSAAQSHLEQALTLNRQFIPALLNLADLKRTQGQRDQAFDYLDQAYRIKPLLPQAGYALAMWYVRGREYDKAVDVLAQTHQAAPANVEVMYAYALALNSAGRSEEALSLLEARTLSPSAPEPLLYLHATLARDAGQVAVATNQVKRLLDLTPNNPNYQALWNELQARSNPSTSPR